MTDLQYTVIDAFTQIRFTGNQAAVVLFEEGDSRYDNDGLLCSIAKEFGFSETAFLLPLPDSSASSPHYRLRWFTPQVEFPLCGHATLASAFTLFRSPRLNTKKIRFETMSGTLRAEQLADGRIELDFPADNSILDNFWTAKKQSGKQYNYEALRSALPSLLEEATGGIPLEIIGFAFGELGLIIEVSGKLRIEGIKMSAKPFQAAGIAPGMVILTQMGVGPSADIESRVFDPVEIIEEDPVTGSAHCMLGPYYLGISENRARLPSSFGGAHTLKAKQVSERGGQLDVLYFEHVDRVLLRGHAVKVMSGTLSL